MLIEMGIWLMSIELPEARILSKQMNHELIGKVVQTYELHNCQNLQKLGCVTRIPQPLTLWLAVKLHRLFHEETLF